MSHIVELQIPADDFELGRILSSGNASRSIEFEGIIPISETSQHCVWIAGSNHDVVDEQLSSHPTVETIEKSAECTNQSLYLLNWTLDYDHLFRYFRECNVQVLDVRAKGSVWRFTLQFSTREQLSQFQDYADAAGITFDVSRVATRQEEPMDVSFGLTDTQRETLVVAVREGYYDIPRRCDTSDISKQFNISEQAVTERLRRAITTLVRNTVLIEEG